MTLSLIKLIIHDGRHNKMRRVGIVQLYFIATLSYRNMVFNSMLAVAMETSYNTCRGCYFDDVIEYNNLAFTTVCDRFNLYVKM